MGWGDENGQGMDRAPLFLRLNELTLEAGADWAVPKQRKRRLVWSASGLPSLCITGRRNCRVSRIEHEPPTRDEMTGYGSLVVFTVLDRLFIHRVSNNIQ